MGRGSPCEEMSMFVAAIENASTFTRAIHSLSRNYGSKVVQPGTATLFFVNSDGWALTCRHVAMQLQAVDPIAKKYQDFKNELASRRGEKTKKLLRQELEKNYKYSENETVELHNRFVNCMPVPGTVEIRSHGTLDVALIRFESFNQTVLTQL